MSTSYHFTAPVPFEKIRNLPQKFLRANGLQIVPNGDNDPMDKTFCLQDGNGNYLHVFAGDDSDSGMERYGRNDVSDILDVLAEHFETSVLSEHDEGFFTDEDLHDEDEDE